MYVKKFLKRSAMAVLALVLAINFHVVYANAYYELAEMRLEQVNRYMGTFECYMSIKPLMVIGKYLVNFEQYNTPGMLDAYIRYINSTALPPSPGPDGDITPDAKAGLPKTLVLFSGKDCYDDDLGFNENCFSADIEASTLPDFLGFNTVNLITNTQSVKWDKIIVYKKDLNKYINAFSYTTSFWHILVGMLSEGGTIICEDENIVSLFRCISLREDLITFSEDLVNASGDEYISKNLIARFNKEEEIRRVNELSEDIISKKITIMSISDFKTSMFKLEI